MKTWHVYFDGEPELIGHICELHKRMGGGIQCADADATGNCAHVQVQRCDCEYDAQCTACMTEFEEFVA